MNLKKRIMESQDLDRFTEEDIDKIKDQQGILAVLTIASLVLLFIFLAIFVIVLIISSCYYLFNGSLWMEWEILIVFISLLLGIISILLGIASVAISLGQDNDTAIIYLKDKFNKK